MRLVTRLEWLAQPPVGKLNRLETPVTLINIIHTATDNCTSHAQCTFHVRTIQTYHVESWRWNDIAFNFLIGGDGAVYQARGWDYRSEKDFGCNEKCITVAFIGTFINNVPPEIQLGAGKKLIAEGLKLGFIKKDYKLVGERQLHATGSPGEALFNEIKTWPHWSDKP